MDPIITCTNCLYYVAFFHNEKEYGGTCHRNSPKAILNSSANNNLIQYGTDWPPVSKDDFCGDYQNSQTFYGITNTLLNKKRKDKEFEQKHAQE